MPRPRWLGDMKMPRSDEYTTSPPIEISPARGRSRPAIERSVVVLPQPLGPSSVKSRPWGTSKPTCCAARTGWPCSSRYSVQRPATFSILGLADAEAPPDPLSGKHEDEESEDEHHAERRKLDVLAVFPQFPDHDGHNFRARAVEEDRARELANGDDDDVDPAGDEPRLEKRQDDAPEGGRP